MAAGAPLGWLNQTPGLTCSAQTPRAWPPAWGTQQPLEVVAQALLVVALVVVLLVVVAPPPSSAVGPTRMRRGLAVSSSRQGAKPAAQQQPKPRGSSSTSSSRGRGVAPNAPQMALWTSHCQMMMKKNRGLGPPP
jgi:hypothetical protein